ncbi:MBL fold metallo-hydrolase [Acetatifactor muris]|uniref:Putative metallo-hydrolase n=1 Tax=Acetatifactor muris TaxID=879566 RepID=A0A2K4ZMU3_9FIRM|nr:MBL fold metallo-hydrolase [Acetatifactor muris]MCR2050127.1 MBL fold metallo-hydrolase [Acetatifactor muris]SOY31788.1 putative metallo-hydrolase [Acetatifactor muris]
MAEIKIGRMVLGVCQTNCYFLYREGAHETIVVDPADKGANIYSALAKNGFQVAGILLTHGHFDHIWGLDGLRDAANAAAEAEGGGPVQAYACEAERELLKSARMNVSEQAGRACETYADVYVKDGQEITLAGMTCTVIATPGHTAGGCCYYFEEAGILVSGDTLFAESVGRTDFPTGSMGTLVRSVKDRLFVLPEDTRVYPGHGESTTIGYEKRNNPFCV